MNDKLISVIREFAIPESGNKETKKSRHERREEKIKKAVTSESDASREQPGRLGKILSITKDSYM